MVAATAAPIVAWRLIDGLVGEGVGSTRADDPHATNNINIVDNVANEGAVRIRIRPRIFNSTKKA